MTGDFVKAMLQLRQADHRRGRRRCGRRRRDHRHGLRHPHRHAGGQDRLPVHPRRPRRLRHGRLRDPAAHHRPGPRRRTALHRPHHDAPRRASAGASTTGWSTPAALEAEALDMAARIAAGPTFAHGMTKTQLNQEWSMGLDQAIEAEAQAQAICMQTARFRARLQGLRRQGKAGVRGRLNGRPLPFSTGRSSRTAIASLPTTGSSAGALKRTCRVDP